MAKEKQKNLIIINTLEHITNVTNVGLRVKEVDNNLVLSFPLQSSIRSFTNKSLYELPKAELIFSRDFRNDLQVSHRFPNDHSVTEDEIVAAIPADAVNEKIVFESVIEFLEKVKNI